MWRPSERQLARNVVCILFGQINVKSIIKSKKRSFQRLEVIVWNGMQLVKNEL